MFVREEVRRQGIARKMFEHLLAIMPKAKFLALPEIVLCAPRSEQHRLIGVQPPEMGSMMSKTERLFYNNEERLLAGEIRVA